MQFLELPLDVFSYVVRFTVQELGLTESMRARLICRAIAAEIPDAVIVRPNFVAEVTTWSHRWSRIKYHDEVIARYLYHRVRTDGPAAHAWITTIRATSEMLLAQTTASSLDGREPAAQAELERIQRSACACLALHAEGQALKVPNGVVSDDRTHLSGATPANCLALAAWMGDQAYISAHYSDSRSSSDPDLEDRDPQSFFGRPSWAAAAAGHAEMVRFLLEHGALPYEPTYDPAPVFKPGQSPLIAASYKSHADVTRLYLQPAHRSPELRRQEEAAIYHAAQGDSSSTVKILLDHYKEDCVGEREYLAVIDRALVMACTRGAPAAVKVLIAEGADVDETDARPRSCLQLAAIANSAQVISMLLEHGASTEAGSVVRQRTSIWPAKERRRQKSALVEAKTRDNRGVVAMIEERMRVLGLATETSK